VTIYSSSVTIEVSQGELGGFVNIAISAMVYIVLWFWRPPVVCYEEAAIVKTARHVLTWTLT